jgi:hypothetical protein
MRLRTLALGLALCCGVTGMAQAGQKQMVKAKKHTARQIKRQNAKRAKQSNVTHATVRKAKKFKPAKMK